MYENLILLGAGATAAISGSSLPTAGNFFTSNAEWSDHKSDFPHLALAYKKVEHLKNKSCDKKSVNLTDIWLFIDTFTKYHSVITYNSSYNFRLLRLRYKEYGNSLPDYLSLRYFDSNYNELYADMRPLPSRLEKYIYHTFPRQDSVNYFLILGGWELKYLNYRTYSPDKETNDLYVKLLEQKNISVINFNWDVYFERACQAKECSIQLALNDNEQHDNNIIYLCKPHGGWNIQHVDNLVLPFRALSDSIEDCFFDRFEDGEVRPAMIPYFLGPDEISEEHGFAFPNVGGYFKVQQEVMKKMFKAAKNIVSIRYSFPEDDRHVLNLIKSIHNRKEKRLLCILKGNDEEKNRIKKIWEFNDGNNSFDYQGNGFNGDSAEKIASWIKNE